MDFGKRLEEWLLDIAASARGLLRLYTRLQDPVQRMRAEKLERLAMDRLTRRVRALSKALLEREVSLGAPPTGADESEWEKAVWLQVFKGVCGVAMLYRFGATQDPSLARLEGAWSRGLRIAIEGFVAAFPMEVTQAQVEQGLREATQEAVEATRDDLARHGSMSLQEAHELAEGMRQEFLLDLGPWVGSVLGSFKA
jgi:hypothetical protein